MWPHYLCLPLKYRIHWKWLLEYIAFSSLSISLSKHTKDVPTLSLQHRDVNFTLAKTCKKHLNVPEPFEHLWNHICFPDVYMCSQTFAHMTPGNLFHRHRLRVCVASQFSRKEERRNGRERNGAVVLWAHSPRVLEIGSNSQLSQGREEGQAFSPCMNKSLEVYHPGRRAPLSRPFFAAEAIPQGGWEPTKSLLKG